MASPSGLLTAPSSSPPATLDQRSLWHSPVTYLFGGLAAMMALIVFALLILACSYWKLSRRLRRQADVSADVEAGAGAGDVYKRDHGDKMVTGFEVEMCVVIMAGEEEPTFLATPSSSTSRTSSFGSNSCRSSSPAMDSSESRNHESAEQVS